ncbi:MAG: O-antigen ligase family protein [Deltaproteobacteria bacterium]|nr:O-antigen ligase family protein [Deltaproteobacteria bacterium]
MSGARDAGTHRRAIRIWSLFVVLWCTTLLYFGAVTEGAIALTAAAMGVLAVLTELSLGPLELSRSVRLLLASGAALVALQLFPIGPAMFGFTDALRKAHGSGSSWPGTADVSETLRASLQTCGYVLAGLVVLRLRQAGLPSRSILLSLFGVLLLEALFAIVQSASERPSIPFFGPRVAKNAPSGTLVSPNSLAGLLSMGIPIAIGLLPRRPPARPGATLERLALVASIALLGACVAVSRSRGGALSAASGLVIALLVGRGRAGVAFVGLVLIGSLAFVGATNPLAQRFVEMGDKSLVAEDRLRYLGITFRAALEQPILGFGFGTFRAAAHPFLPADIGGDLRHPHNEYVNLLFETGLVGCLIAVLSLGTWARRLRGGELRSSPSGRRAAAAGAVGVGLIHGAVDFDLQITSIGLLFAAMLALAPSVRRDATKAPGWLSGVALAAGLLIGAQIALPSADEALEESRRAELSARGEILRRGLGLHPFDVKLAYEKSLVSLDLGDRKLAAEQLERAADLWPAHGSLQDAVVGHLFRMHLESKDPEDLERAGRIARRRFSVEPSLIPAAIRAWAPVATPIDALATLIPASPRAQASFAVLLASRGLVEEALARFQNGCPALPENAPIFDSFAATLDAQGQWGLAAELRDQRLTAKRDGEGLAGAARAWIRVGATEDALFRAAEASELEPDRPEWKALVGEILVELGEWEPAATAYAAASSLAPANGNHRAWLGALLLVDGETKLERGAEHLAAALALGADSKQILLPLATQLKARGELEAARRVADAYLSLDGRDASARALRKSLVE